jgi:hypothetical protein
MLFGIPKSAMCVQRFDDSLNSAIHTTYRISLRSSSMREPRDPLLKVVCDFTYSTVADRNDYHSDVRLTWVCILCTRMWRLDLLAKEISTLDDLQDHTLVHFWISRVFHPRLHS